MSFDFSTLVTDRTQADVNRVKQIAEKIKNGTASESELAEFNSAAMKGAYNYTDLNRVTAAMEALKAKLEGYGYAVPGYQRIKVPHPVTGGGNKLPEGYTELQYIESTGTQYIDTDFAPNQDTKIMMVAEPVSVANVSASGGFAPYGAGNTSTDRAFELYSWNSKYNPNYDGQTITTGTAATGKKLTITQDKNVFTLVSSDGTTVSHTFTYNSFTTPYTLTLFAVHRASLLKGLQKIYSCQLYDNGTIIRDYIPCINPDGFVGLYDLVTETFYGNAGTGSFVAGAIPRKLPEGYTQVEYIESSGTQFVDTAYKAASENYRINCKFAVVDDTANKVLFGGGASTDIISAMLTSDSNLKFYVGSGSVAGALSPFVVGTEYEMECHANNGTFSVKLNGVSRSGSYSGTINKDYPLFIFANNVSGSASQHSSIRVFEFKIYDDDMLVRFYVPCVNETGSIGVYDLVSEEFYGNAGSGTFEVGEEIDHPKFSPVEEETYDPYLWYEFDWPTTETMTVYLLNVSAIRAVLAVLRSTPEVPTDMERLMTRDANDIEAILLDVYRQLTIMPTTFIPCGEALCGGDNL